MSDSEYSILFEFMKSRYPDDEYVTRSWSSDPCPVDLLKKHNLLHLAESIALSEKTESIPSLNTWESVQRELSGFQGRGTLSMKHDGWNIQASYVGGHLIKVETRGRSSKSMDVSALSARLPQTVPWTETSKVILEATVSKRNFDFCRYQFGNASERSAVHTVLAKPEYLHLIDLHAFDIHGVNLKGVCKFDKLQEAKFQVPKYYEVHDYEEILSCMEKLSVTKDDYASPTDGIVFDGPFTRAIRLMSWEEPILRSYVELLIRPIARDGGTQRRIAITNWQRIIDNNLRPGYPVAFRLASGATADFDAESTRLLQKEFEGHYDMYRNLIDGEEAQKACLRNVSRYVSAV